MASVGHPQRRSVPRRDQSAERGECRKIHSRNRRENVLVLETSIEKAYHDTYDGILDLITWCHAQHLIKKIQRR